MKFKLSKKQKKKLKAYAKTWYESNLSQGYFYYEVKPTLTSTVVIAKHTLVEKFRVDLTEYP